MTWSPTVMVTDGQVLPVIVTLIPGAEAPSGGTGVAFRQAIRDTVASRTMRLYIRNREKLRTAYPFNLAIFGRYPV